MSEFMSQFNQAQQRFIKPALNLQELTNRFFERSLRYSLEVFNDHVKSLQEGMGDLQNAKKVEDMLKVQSKMTADAGNKAAGYAQQALDMWVETSQDYNKWVEKGLKETSAV